MEKINNRRNPIRRVISSMKFDGVKAPLTSLIKELNSNQPLSEEMLTLCVVITNEVIYNGSADSLMEFLQDEQDEQDI